MVILLKLLGTFAVLVVVLDRLIVVEVVLVDRVVVAVLSVEIKGDAIVLVTELVTFFSFASASVVVAD